MRTCRPFSSKSALAASIRSRTPLSPGRLSSSSTVPPKGTPFSAAFPLLYGCGSTAGIAAALEKGRVTAIAAVNVFSAGYLAVEAAAKLARHESWTGGSSVGFSIVRQETMYSSDNQKLLFPVT